MDRDPDPYRLYAIIRRDLDMTPGKISAQSGHAYLDSYLMASEMRPETIPQYKTNHGIKICLECKNLSQMERAYERLYELQMPAVLITDLGYTVFEGQPTITALGIGPCKKDEIWEVIKRFRLMK